MGHEPPEGTGSLGYGDPTSCHIMREAIRWTKEVGAVRHGAEAFNYHFPQDLDGTYLVTWDGYPGLKWRYLSEPKLREFLLARVADGFAFPLNPKWVLCDAGWSQVWRALCDADGGARLEPWFPSGSGIRELIERVLASHPNGHPVQSHAEELADTSALDRQLEELRHVKDVDGRLRSLRRSMHVRLSTASGGRFAFRGVAEARAATLIQAHVRRLRAQVRIAPLLEQARRMRASVLIQARARGRAVRRQVGKAGKVVRRSSAKALNALERVTGIDLDRDGDVGVAGSSSGGG